MYLTALLLLTVCICADGFHNHKSFSPCIDMMKMMTPEPNGNNNFDKIKTFKEAFMKQLTIEQEKQRSNIDLFLFSNSTKKTIAQDGKLYFTTWLSIYLSCLITLFNIIDKNLFNVDPDVINPEKVYTWIESHLYLPYIHEILQLLRENPRGAVFAQAYLITDFIPTTLIALALFPMVQSIFGRRTDKHNEEKEGD